MNYKEFSALLEDLKAGGNERLKSIFEENAAYCMKGLVHKHNCSAEDAEDIYMDAVLNFRDKILSGKIEVLTDTKNYLYATCKNMFLASLKKKQRVSNAAVEIYHYDGVGDLDSHLDDHTSYQEEMIRLTEEGLEALGDKCCDLLKSFYFFKLSLDEIAKKYNMANANVAKVSKSRCFRKLVSEIKSIQQHKVRR